MTGVIDPPFGRNNCRSVFALKDYVLFLVMFGLGTIEQLMNYRPKTKAIVVTMQYVDDVTKFDPAKQKGIGDFVILTDAKQPRSQR